MYEKNALKILTVFRMKVDEFGWRVRLPVRARLRNDIGQVVHTLSSYNLVPANGRWRSAAGKVTVGLTSGYPCVTDFSGLFTYGPGLWPVKGRWLPTLRSYEKDLYCFTARRYDSPTVRPLHASIISTGRTGFSTEASVELQYIQK